MLRISKFLIVVFIVLMSLLLSYTNINNSTNLNDECKNVAFESREIYLQSAKSEKRLKVLVADDRCERAKGLMDRHEFDDYDGMIFIHQESGIYSYWMKNTYLNLNIAFFDEDYRFLNVYQNVKLCEKDNCDSYISNGNARYVLETKAEIDLREFYNENTLLKL